MATQVERDDEGRVVLVISDEKVTDPESEEAVQVPVALDRQENAREVNAEENDNVPGEQVNPAFEAAKAEKKSSKSTKDE